MTRPGPTRGWTRPVVNSAQDRAALCVVLYNERECEKVADDYNTYDSITAGAQIGSFSVYARGGRMLTVNCEITFYGFTGRFALTALRNTPYQYYSSIWGFSPAPRRGLPHFAA